MTRAMFAQIIFNAEMGEAGTAAEFVDVADGIPRKIVACPPVMCCLAASRKVLAVPRLQLRVASNYLAKSRQSRLSQVRWKGVTFTKGINQSLPQKSRLILHLSQNKSCKISLPVVE